MISFRVLTILVFFIAITIGTGERIVKGPKKLQDVINIEIDGKDVYYRSKPVKPLKSGSTCKSGQTVICIDNRCSCLPPMEPKIVVDTEKTYKKVKRNKPRILRKLAEPGGINPPGFIDLTAIRTPKYPQKEEYNDKPIMRHHIAHFCPNLDDARDCIRKCMKEGKPAFCGKDHVCYCGHKYTNTQTASDDKANPKAIYAQFQDLYKKYFGDTYSPDPGSDEDKPK